MDCMHLDEDFPDSESESILRTSREYLLFHAQRFSFFHGTLWTDILDFPGNRVFPLGRES